MKLRNKVKLFAAVCIADVCLFAGLVRIAERPAAVSAYTRDHTAVSLRFSSDEEELPNGADMKFVALTFDDGPDRECTVRLLDGLRERGVHVTFFLMGENIEGNEDVVKRMSDEGHLIGNHSYKHVQLTKAGVDQVCQAVERTSSIIEEITGERPRYLRPPYGDWNEDLECRMDMETVLWSVDSLDWKLRSREKIVRRVLKDVEDGDIILMHDIFPSSVTAALDIVDRLREQGYTFVTVNELLID